jgi:hypothetical protein
MSNIAKLAVQVQMNIGNLIDNAAKAANSIDSIAKAAEKSTAGVRNFKDSVTGLEILLQATADAQSQLVQSINTLDHSAESLKKFNDAKDAVQKMKEVSQKVFDSAVAGAEKLSSEILKLKPNIQGIEAGFSALKASMRLERLAGTGQVTGDLEKLKNLVTQNKEALNQLAVASAGKIADFSPSLEGIRKAQKEIENLRAVIQQIRQETGDMSFGAEALAEAERNANQLGEALVRNQVEQQAFNSIVTSVQQFPFLILANFAKDFLNDIKSLFSVFDEKFPGVLSTFSKVMAGLTAIIVLLGLANTQTFTWAGSTAFLQSLWSGNLIVMGLKGVVAWIATSVLGYNTLTAATIAWWSAATLGIAAVIAAIVAIVGYLFFWRDSTEQAAAKTERLQSATEKYKESLDGIVDRHKKILDYMNQAREAAKTPEQKSADREKQLQDAVNEPERLRRQTESLKRQIAGLKAQQKLTRDKEEKEALQKQADDAQKTLKDLQKMQRNMKPLTQAEITNQRALNLQAEMNDRNVAQYLPKNTAAQEYARAKNEIEALHRSGKILTEQRNAMLQNAEKVFKDNDPLQKEIQKLVDKFKGMQRAKSPVEAFDQLSQELNRVKDRLSPEEFADAQQKLLDDLTKGLGIADFVNPKQSETLESVQQKILDYYNKLDALGKATFDLTAAQQRATESFAKQSEFYNLYEGAMKEMNPDTLEKAMLRLQEEAEKFNWGDDIRTLMEEKLKAKFEKDEENTDQIAEENTKTKTQQTASNAALELGTVAYYEAQKKGNDPILKENQKQTKTLETIARNTATNSETNNVQLILIS